MKDPPLEDAKLAGERPVAANPRPLGAQPRLVEPQLAARPLPTIPMLVTSEIPVLVLPMHWAVMTWNQQYMLLFIVKVIRRLMGHGLN